MSKKRETGATSTTHPYPKAGWRTEGLEDRKRGPGKDHARPPEAAYDADFIAVT